MINPANTVREKIAKAAGVQLSEIKLEHPEVEGFGDYSSNIAMMLKGGKKLAEEIVAKLNNDVEFVNSTGRAEVAGPGFVNIKLNVQVLKDLVAEINEQADEYGKGRGLAGRKIMVEFAHPNTHKELHIGHMRTLITGEALSRILEFSGAEVFRANYQGDIGPHVAKAIWGVEKLMEERHMNFEEAENMSPGDKAHLLGEGYVEGNRGYEEHKLEIDGINNNLYKKSSDVWPIYERTRRWSLDYYKSFYERFGTRFDRLFFESEVAADGRVLVEKNIGKVFERSEGAVIFDGEKYGLHKRVFVTADGNPTYEGKEMALAFLQRNVFDFDKCIHVVANEQAGYFQVVIKALESIDSEFAGREFHLSMGMVNLIGRKISSRTGDIMTVDGLLDEVKEMLPVKTDEARVSEAITLGAVKYSVLKTHPAMNVAFDLKQSVSLEGNSGPYLQYTYARTRSVLAKAGEYSYDPADAYAPNEEELAVMRYIYRFPEVVSEAANRYSPNLIGNFLYESASRFNGFYNKHSILGNANAQLPNETDLSVIRFRLALTAAVSQCLKSGLELLGIVPLSKM